METFEYTPQEFYQKAYDMGFTPREVRRLRSNRLFPQAKKKGLGWGKGIRYYYIEDSIDDLKTLVHWHNQPQCRDYKDLRWSLWLYGNWDWLWDDIKKDLLELAPSTNLEKNDESEAIPILGGFLSTTRYKLFKKSQQDLWKLIAPSLIEPFVYKFIDQASVSPIELPIENEVIDFPEEMDELLGEGSYSAYQMAINMGIFSYSRMMSAIKDASSEQTLKHRAFIQKFENLVNEDKQYMMIKRFLGIRPFRKIGLQRLPRLIAIGIALMSLSPYLKDSK